ncbi:hypothetical protein EDB92DRAFT_1918082 [Lactarius akahatsu]|uniref:Protein kinase domain-containing protein n=1 Tax=Lactarius akahatsu TaxID=416441 RepID=A0AAD4Q249_9AGAM|nr:hypothetical protein EDB92DRAFT_1918082 [Lactarius akahatsu]
MDPPTTCLLLVDHNFRALGEPFEVETTHNINGLKAKAKEARQIDLANVDAARLTVWKTKGTMVIDDSNSERFEEILGRINVDDKDTIESNIERLKGRQRVADLQLSDGRALLVRVPDVTLAYRRSESVVNEERAHRKAIENANKAPPPSSVSKNVKTFKAEQAKHPIYNGRPAGRRGPPVTIYHKAFAELKDALRDLTKTEAERCKAVIPLLERLLDITLIEKPKLAKDFEPDAVVTQAIKDVTYGEMVAVIGYVEFNNEFGSGEMYKEIRNACCCPCITISVAGPYISIGGAILVDVFTFESFTSYLYLGGQPYTQESIIGTARIFSAVSQAFVGLKRFYQDLELKANPQLYRLFPSPTYLADKMPQSKLTFSSRFEYEGRKSDDYRRSLFRATYDDREVLVKFCQQYHGDAHHLVAVAHYAPKLFFCERIRGGVTMVIMELIAGQDAYYRFTNVDLPSSILDDLKSALAVLHDSGLVFGDLRRPNIVIDTKGDRDRALLIDFEWVGRDGQARYPALLNNSGEIKWPTGVAPHGIMQKEHDIEMIDKLNVKYWRCLLGLSTNVT